MVAFRREDVVAFLSRGWAESRRLKDEHWARLSPMSRWRAVEGLRLHMKRIRPQWPTPAERDADLRHHIRLSKLLAKTARAFSGPTRG